MHLAGELNSGLEKLSSSKVAGREIGLDWKSVSLSRVLISDSAFRVNTFRKAGLIGAIVGLNNVMFVEWILTIIDSKVLSVLREPLIPKTAESGN